MKLDVLTVCLLCFHLETSTVDGSCKACTDRCEGNHDISIPEVTDGLPRRGVTFHCPLPKTALSFHMKLSKGLDREELCSFYAENRTENSSTKSCNPVLSTNRVSFEIRNSSTEVDTYTCCLEVLLPVYRCCITRETRVYVYIQEIQESQQNQAQDPEECVLSEFTTWTLVILTAVSTVSCFCCFLFCCLRNTVCQHSASSRDYNNEYMSMAAVIPNEKSRREHLRRPIAV